MVRGLVLERLANLLANASYVMQVEIAVRLTRRTDANKRQFRLANCLRWIFSRAQPARLDLCRDNFADLCFDNWRMPFVDQVYFGLDWIDANDFMSVVGQTSS
jgi:hypothetical protein